MAYGFRPIFLANLYVVWFVCDCVMVKNWFHGVLGLSKTEHCVLGQQNPVNRPHQLRTTITFSSELRFERSWTLRKSR